MIQEKDFLYRVPVKTAPITTPGGQIRNPEILVDVEGGEFMHGNILDANSTNKLINQSVKDAVDNKLIESGYVTKDLLEAETTRATEQENSLKTLIGAETSARTKGDEDLSSKIKAEQTRAEGKEKEISDKLAIVNGDSNTEGSFRKAIADVVAAAPEDLDTLKEIADKLAGNDDLHTALNQAITEKADASALLNEVTRATGAESGLQAAIATKADAAALSNYVLKTELPTVPTKTSQLTNDSNFLTAADVDFTPYATTQALTAVEQKVTANTTALEDKQDAGYYVTYIRDDGSNYALQKGFKFSNETNNVTIDESGVDINTRVNSITLNDMGIRGDDGNNSYQIGGDGIHLLGLDTEIRIKPIGISSVADGDTNLFNIDSTAIILGPTNDPNVKISEKGIKFKGRAASDIPIAGGEFVKMNSFVLAQEYNSKIKSLEARIAALEAKLPEAAA